MSERFSEPFEDWDAYTQRQDAVWASYVLGMTCSQCRHFTQTPDGKSAFGFCKNFEEWQSVEASVALLDCDAFEKKEDHPSIWLGNKQAED